MEGPSDEALRCCYTQLASFHSPPCTQGDDTVARIAIIYGAIVTCWV